MRTGGVAKEGQENPGKCGGVCRESGKLATEEGESEAAEEEALGEREGAQPREGSGVRVAGPAEGRLGKEGGAFTLWSGGQDGCGEKFFSTPNSEYFIM